MKKNHENLVSKYALRMPKSPTPEEIQKLTFTEKNIGNFLVSVPPKNQVFLLKLVELISGQLEPDLRL